MSWESVEEKKTCPNGTGIVTITTRSDDWNRCERSVSVDCTGCTETCHPEEYHWRTCDGFSYTTVYAVPQDITLDIPLNLQKPNFKIFEELLCNKFNKERLTVIKEKLHRNRSIYSAAKGSVLGDIVTIYIQKYGEFDCIRCLNSVMHAIDLYDDYEFNYEKYTAMVRVAEEEKNESIRKAKQASVIID